MSDKKKILVVQNIHDAGIQLLKENPNYFFTKHQKEQLWGKKLQAGSQLLFNHPKLKSIIKTASANSNFTNEKEK